MSQAWGQCDENCGQAVSFRCRYCKMRYCRNHITSHAHCSDPDRDALRNYYRKERPYHAVGKSRQAR